MFTGGGSTKDDDDEEDDKEEHDKEDDDKEDDDKNDEKRPKFLLFKNRRVNFYASQAFCKNPNNVPGGGRLPEPRTSEYQDELFEFQKKK